MDKWLLIQAHRKSNQNQNLIILNKNKKKKWENKILNKQQNQYLHFQIRKNR